MPDTMTHKRPLSIGDADGHEGPVEFLVTTRSAPVTFYGCRTCLGPLVESVTDTYGEAVVTPTT